MMVDGRLGILVKDGNTGSGIGLEILMPEMTVLWTTVKHSVIKNLKEKIKQYKRHHLQAPVGRQPILKQVTNAIVLCVLLEFL